ncbi:hypothetical protein DUNSADRAFT_1610 [Dunaliella salina]|uniref:Uncharacterized protein n=1 Tax=Dunaliella salina TaxID=3046 RepID=A0ABQ7H8J8_DUNSA|nr:hypothetical protein DUNSADRAFT_1610 [Dunaliella salina]|eukprot:KAF5843183.1 hypothetical protein DUNSADRAFT_1610 [Dunaliella salina]
MISCTTKCRWQFMWALVRLDLREAMAEVSNLYVTDSLEVYTGQLVLHVVILVAMLVLVTLYMWMLFLPFLRHTITESHRVAELLTQLPEEANVEAMMEVSWQAVKNDMEIKASENSRLFRRAKPEELTNRISKSFAGARKSFSDFRERVSKSFSLDVVKKPPGRPSRDSAHMLSNKVAPVDTGKAAVDLLPTEQDVGEDGDRHLGRVRTCALEQYFKTAAVFFMSESGLIRCPTRLRLLVSGKLLLMCRRQSRAWEMGTCT